MQLFLEQFPIVVRSLNVGFLQTLKLFFVTLIGAIPLGLVIALGSMSRVKPLSILSRVVVWIIRGSPLMIQLLIIFYFPGIVPPMSNEIITLVKDTSLARIIALQEIIWAGQAFMKSSMGISGAIWPLFFTGVYYLACNGLLTLLFGWVERKLSYYKV